ncbi:MAG: cupredoxin domain-containing protein [Actinobacteria bacterium]|nr:cupredoxin domain-containing protein [Actinomycetota bacterium]
MVFRRIAVLLFAAALGAGGLTACSSDGGGGGGDQKAKRPFPSAPELAVTGDSLSFDPDELTVPAGKLNIALTAGDQFHDFVIEDVDGIVEAGSGETETAGFEITKPGEYTFYCSVPGHRQGGMEGTLTVE